MGSTCNESASCRVLSITYSYRLTGGDHAGSICACLAQPSPAYSWAEQERGACPGARVFGSSAGSGSKCFPCPLLALLTRPCSPRCAQRLAQRPPDPATAALEPSRLLRVPYLVVPRLVNGVSKHEMKAAVMNGDRAVQEISP